MTCRAWGGAGRRTWSLMRLPHSQIMVTLNLEGNVVTHASESWPGTGECMPRTGCEIWGQVAHVWEMYACAKPS